MVIEIAKVYIEADIALITTLCFWWLLAAIATIIQCNYFAYIVLYRTIRIGGASWPKVGAKPQNHYEHATQIKDEATKLLDNPQKRSTPFHVLEPFLSSCIELAQKVIDQPTAKELMTTLQAMARRNEKERIDLKEHYLRNAHRFKALLKATHTLGHNDMG